MSISIAEGVKMIEKIGDHLINNPDDAKKAKEGRDADEEGFKDKMTERIFKSIEEGDSEMKGRFSDHNAFRKAFSAIKVRLYISWNRLTKKAQTSNLIYKLYFIRMTPK